MSIQILPQEVINQIAAGEVVERPAFLVKELVENSLDADATEIEIEFDSGGKFVQVSDNGRGIAPDEIGKALDRFATSKIREADDLWSLVSFGFRGEALASIASVSKLTVTSRRASDLEATRLEANFGVKEEPFKMSGRIGTVVRVEELFANTPARLKFQKSEVAEHSQIKTTIRALALANPTVTFRIVEKNKLVAHWSAVTDLKSRAEQILEIEKMYTNTAIRGPVQAEVVFASPQQVAKSGRNIWIFAQDRWIQDKGAQAAVMESYRNLLMHGEFPFVVVKLTMPPEFVDVNIHPTKSQVKFQDNSFVFRAVAAALREGLERAPWIQTREMTFSSESNLRTEELNSGFESPEAQKAENIKFQSPELERTQFKTKLFTDSSPSVQPTIEKNNSGISDALIKFSVQSQKMNLSPGVYRSSAAASSAKNSVAEVQTTHSNYWSQLQVIGQANQTYIVCQADSGLVFVDQHAAHERVAFERLMAAWAGGAIDVQEFLFPLHIELSPEKVEALVSYFSDLSRLGIHLEQLGPSAIGVKAAPSLLKDSILGDVLDKMSQDILDQGGSFLIQKAIGDVCATMACHSVVRAGQALSQEQMQSLLVEMDLFPLSSFCPHGRPVSVEYPFYRLEKEFGRIV